VTDRPFHRGRGRGRKTPRIVSGSRPATCVENMLEYLPELRDQEWVRYRVKDGQKGPMLWEVKCVPFFLQGPDGLPIGPWRLVVARNVLDPSEVKFFVSNALPETSVGTILLAAFSRWRVERCFEDDKGEVGLDHYEGRRYPGLKRHLILSSISYLFLAETNQRLRGKKSRMDRLPSPHGGVSVDSLVVARRSRFVALAATHGGVARRRAIPQRLGATLPRQTKTSNIAENGHQTDRNPCM